jgi:hypothetical protein
MRTLLLSLLALGAVACGGNISNEDLEFLNALPEREDLASALPDSPSNAARLDGSVQALALGELSKLYVDTRRASENFNKGVDGLLTLLEGIRRRPPTTRAPGVRTWGPFPDRDHPGMDVRFRMRRDAARFEYTLQYRRSGEGEEGWWSLIVGHFDAEAGGIRKGEGSVSLLLREARAHGFAAGGLEALDTLSIGYQTRTLPIQVQEIFEFAPGAGPTELRYTYRAFPEGPGEMTFTMTDIQATPGTALETLDITSRWTADRGGIGTVVVRSGDYAGARKVECWDADFRTTYERANWDPLGGAGELRSCPDVSAFGPVPGT